MDVVSGGDIVAVNAVVFASGALPMPVAVLAVVTLATFISAAKAVGTVARAMIIIRAARMVSFVFIGFSLSKQPRRSREIAPRLLCFRIQ